MKIKIGDTFTVGPKKDSRYLPYEDITKGSHSSPADINKGIFPSAKVTRNNHKISPAIIFFSNPFKEGTENTPWRDIIDPDRGFAIYHGDNKNEEKNALDSHGNKVLGQILPYYDSSSELRKYAPPILLFKQVQVDGQTKGYRKFCGYGIPTKLSIQSQKKNQNGKAFSNLVIELCLMSLANENEDFDWNWIDALRGGKLSAEKTLELAPLAWKKWVKCGKACIEQVRRNILFKSIPSTQEQKLLSPRQVAILTNIDNYYDKRKHSFEGLASYIASRVLGPNYIRGWVTQKSGDGGVDFVSKMQVGSAFSSCPIVILGQAKCINHNTSVNAQDTARLVARLQRGWLGVVVTTGYFSQHALKEWKEDNYPLILINGKRLADEILDTLREEGLNEEKEEDVKILLDRETSWFHNNLSHQKPYQILETSILTSLEGHNMLNISYK